MTESVLDYIIWVYNFEWLSPKNFRGQKHAKFDAILDNFELWRQIYPEKWMNIFKIGQVHFLLQFLPLYAKKVW